MKIGDTLPPFLTLPQPHLFYQPLHFYGKNLNPPSRSPPLQRGGQVQVKTVTFTD